jgi:hypothetical protein
MNHRFMGRGDYMLQAANTRQGTKVCCNTQQYFLAHSEKLTIIFGVYGLCAGHRGRAV